MSIPPAAAAPILLKKDGFEIFSTCALYQNRSKELLDTIRERFRQAQEGTWYKNNGNPQYYLELKGTYINSDELLDKIAAKNTTLLDLGTGNGEFVVHAGEKFGVRAVGISATDFRTDDQKSKMPHHQYVLGNVETLSLWFQGQFNIIMASWLFLHLTDPLGTLEEIYDSHLEVGGYLIVHKMYIHCGDKKNAVQFTEELVHYLNREGNCRAAAGIKTCENVGLLCGQCDFFFLQKLNNKPLNLPIRFLEQLISNRFNHYRVAGYQIDPSKNVPKCLEKDDLIVGCQNPLDFFPNKSNAV